MVETRTQRNGASYAARKERREKAAVKQKEPISVLKQKPKSKKKPAQRAPQRRRQRANHGISTLSGADPSPPVAVPIQALNQVLIRELSTEPAPAPVTVSEAATSPAVIVSEPAPEQSTEQAPEPVADLVPEVFEKSDRDHTLDVVAYPANLTLESPIGVAPLAAISRETENKIIVDPTKFPNEKSEQNEPTEQHSKRYEATRNVYNKWNSDRTERDRYDRRNNWRAPQVNRYEEREHRKVYHDYNSNRDYRYRQESQRKSGNDRRQWNHRSPICSSSGYMKGHESQEVSTEFEHPYMRNKPQDSRNNSNKRTMYQTSWNSEATGYTRAQANFPAVPPVNERALVPYAQKASLDERETIDSEVKSMNIPDATENKILWLVKNLTKELLKRRNEKEMSKMPEQRNFHFRLDKEMEKKARDYVIGYIKRKIRENSIWTKYAQKP
ncbi:unnamed protein product [Caenorhabditis sp. 36 PRJEB53466]|nr:unnamed protein product [Caenorhabditis sp. 36 PRJEB53466]